MFKKYTSVPTEDPVDATYLQNQLNQLRNDFDVVSFYLKITFIFCILIVMGVLGGGYTMWFHYNKNGWYSNAGRRTDLNGDGYVKGKLTTSTLNTQNGEFVTLNVTQSENIVGTLHVTNNVTLDQDLNVGGNAIVNGTSKFVGNMTITDSLTVGRVINILTSQFQLGGKTVIEDNFQMTGLGTFAELGQYPIRFGNVDHNDIVFFSSKSIFLWETSPEGFPLIAYPLGGSNGLSMSLGTGGLLVNNAISAGGQQVGSSRQIKENIIDYPADEALTRLMAIRPRKYNYKQWWLDYLRKPNITMGGFIAEEIRDDVDPSMVSEILTTNRNLINGTLVTLKKEDLHTIEIKVIQTLVNENTDLKARVTLLETLFAQLNATING